MMSSTPHLCPSSQLPQAAKTLTSVLCAESPLPAFLYNSPTLLPSVPYGKCELLAIWLRNLHRTGLILTVDDGDEKCVGVAVWLPPAGRKGAFLDKLKTRWFCAWLDLWLYVNKIYYGRAGFNPKVQQYPPTRTQYANRRKRPNSTVWQVPNRKTSLAQSTRTTTTTTTTRHGISGSLR
jgi:hypothetical protein